MSGITNYQILRSINILLCGISIGFEAYAYENSFAKHENVELLYLGFMGFFMAESILSLLIFGKKSRIILEVIWRLLCSAGLIVISCFLIYYAVDIQNTYFYVGCKVANEYGYLFDGKKCQRYELKLAAAIISIVNGVVYTFITGFQKSKNEKEQNLVFPGPGGSKIYMHPTTPYFHPQPEPHFEYQPRPILFSPPPAQAPLALPMPSPAEVIPIQQFVPRAHLLHRTDSYIFNNKTGEYEYERQKSKSKTVSPSPTRTLAPGIQKQVTILSQKAAEAGQKLQRQNSKLAQGQGQGGGHGQRTSPYRY